MYTPEKESKYNGFGDASSPDLDLDDYVIRADVKALPVPEPGAMALLGLGAVGVGLTRLKRRDC
jgi:hypothetical protein